MQVDAESGAQRRGEQSATGCCPHESEGVEVNLYRARRRSLVYHDVYAVVLHSRVEILLDDGRQAVNLVDEQHVVRLERRQYACQVARLVEHGTARQLEAHAQLVGNDVAQRGLSQSGRAVQQGVVERLAAVFGGLYEHLEVLHHLLLSAEVAEAQRSQGVLKLLLGRRQRLFSYIEIIIHYSFIFQSNAKLSILFVIITQNHKNISAAADGGVTVSGRPPCRRSVLPAGHVVPAPVPC